MVAAVFCEMLVPPTKLYGVAERRGGACSIHCLF